MAEMVYLNGALLPRRRALVSAYDQGFLYGYGLFETMRSYGGKIFLLERHIQRLLDGAAVIGLGGLPSAAGLAQACDATLKANDVLDARLRLAVSRGEAESFSGGGGQPTLMVTARPYVPPPPGAYQRGYRTLVSSLRHCSRSPLAGLKSANYLLSVLAKREADAAGLDEALLLNERGAIAEGSISNVFFAAGSRLVTPPLDSGILPGITRRAVLELGDSLGISVAEREVGLADIGQFGEAFLTNSLMEIMPLVGVKEGDKDINIGDGSPGDITRRLMAAYRRMVVRETG